MFCCHHVFRQVEFINRGGTQILLQNHTKRSLKTFKAEGAKKTKKEKYQTAFSQELDGDSVEDPRDSEDEGEESQEGEEESQRSFLKEGSDSEVDMDEDPDLCLVESAENKQQGGKHVKSASRRLKDETKKVMIIFSYLVHEGYGLVSIFNFPRFQAQRNVKLDGLSWSKSINPDERRYFELTNNKFVSLECNAPKDPISYRVSNNFVCIHGCQTLSFVSQGKKKTYEFSGLRLLKKMTDETTGQEKITSSFTVPASQIPSLKDICQDILKLKQKAWVSVVLRKSMGQLDIFQYVKSKQNSRVFIWSDNKPWTSRCVK